MPLSNNPVIHVLPVEDSLSFIHEPSGPLANKHVPGAKEYYPLNQPAIGSAFSSAIFAKNAKLPKLFTPLHIRDMEIKNRIWVSPMCQYSSPNGLATDWHLVHIGGFATRGAGLISMEATSVTANGRITPEDNGIWSDAHIAPLKRIVDFVHSQGTKIGIQLSHAGRKASTRAPWGKRDIKGNYLSGGEKGSDVATVEEGGWPDDVVAPSAIGFTPAYPEPNAMREEQVEDLVKAFEAAALRAKAAGFDFIELHGAHGYLVHQFCSPLSNKRTDQWGGQSLENRLRLPITIATRVRAVWGFEKPIFYRVSGADWAEGPEQDPATQEWLQWGPVQSTHLARALHSTPEIAIDLFDVSSGGLWAAQKIPVGPGYQVFLGEHIKKALPELLVTSVGAITDAKQAEEIVSVKGLDAVWLAREMLRHVDFPLKAAEELGVVVKPAAQYERAWTRMLKD
ncbi:FMN-linked oxidoreductase [Clavulina sp. PMI_390]|nr:FMN-linked oxidoreductase [Clavulina sp. PMI_390]